MTGSGKTGTKKFFAVTGNPVFHSKSPAMHNAAFQALGLPYQYLRLAADSGKEALTLASSMGLSGLNVTAPFKEEMSCLCEDSDGLTAKVKAANTVVFDDGKQRAFNTDVYGVEEAFKAHGVQISGRRALIIGAGGAAYAAAEALRRNKARLCIANRTVEKAEKLARIFDAEYSSLKKDDISRRLAESELIVSCLGFTDRVFPQGLVKKHHAILDAHYAGETAISSDGRAAGALVMSGREWLLYQGVKAFEYFTGRNPPLEVMRTALENSPRREVKGIALTGFMASGKSSVSAELSRLSGLGTCCLDEEIEKAAGCKIPEIFSNRGEEAFRELESSCLRKSLSADPRILACGGGAVLRAGNREFLKENYINIWLWVSPEEVLRRTAGDFSRPLLRSPDRSEAVKKLLAERMDFYAETCDLVVGTEGRTPEQIAEKIINETRKALAN